MSFICVIGFRVVGFFFFKQKTAYEMRISDWSSDVCSSDLALALGSRGLGLVGGEHDLARGGARRGRQAARDHLALGFGVERRMQKLVERVGIEAADRLGLGDEPLVHHVDGDLQGRRRGALAGARLQLVERAALHGRSEEHTSELQSLMRISYAVFCLKKKKKRE